MEGRPKRTPALRAVTARGEDRVGKYDVITTPRAACHFDWRVQLWVQTRKRTWLADKVGS
jgi:hypothetical protein